MDEDYSDHNRVVGRMKHKMHNKISHNSRKRGGVKEKNEEIVNGGEEDHALDFKTLMLQSMTTTL